MNPGNQAAVGFVEVEVTVEETPDEYAWMFHARCRGINPAEFFPSDGTGVETAQRVCAACPVRVECLEYALVNRIEHGVWGGAPNANAAASCAGVATSRHARRA